MIEGLRALFGGRILIEVGDITEFRGDAVVNAANSGLLGGGGVDGAIHRAAGPELLEACRRLRAGALRDGLPPGQAVMTPGFALAAGAVIHAVGPIWMDGKSGERKTLRAAYENSLALAAEAGFKDIAFPAISTGVYGYPKRLAALDAHAAVLGFLSHSALPERAHLVFFARADAKIFLDALAEAGAEPP